MRHQLHRLQFLCHVFLMESLSVAVTIQSLSAACRCKQEKSSGSHTGVHLVQEKLGEVRIIMLRGSAALRSFSLAIVTAAVWTCSPGDQNWVVEIRDTSGRGLNVAAIVV